ncbi:MAG: hypothetical protein DWP98_00210 [Bacteroidetes bacterium]|nr:MAG: hypothetical protein DWP98_00210 [Bacteroidota bacterium]MBL1144981.1 hypothetical protein [Bacteroidota bacterium]NOG57776.1 hypothetical protein [Bacteroidota bacterium]
MFEEEEESNKVKKSALFIKANEIYVLVSKIASLIPEEDSLLSSFRDIIIEDAFTICSKVAGAYNSDIYEVRMESAVLIRKAALDLKLQYHNLKAFEFREIEYYPLIIGHIEEFRLLFLDWVDTFDETDKLEDEWGLFS